MLYIFDRKYDAFMEYYWKKCLWVKIENDVVYMTRCRSKFMDVRFVLDALVITTIVIFAVCLGLVGYSSIKKKLAAQK